MNKEHPKTEQACKDNPDLPRKFVSDLLHEKDAMNKERLPFKIYAHDCTGLPSGAWRTDDEFSGTPYINQSQLIELIQGMKYTEDQGMDHEMEMHNLSLDEVLKAIGEK